VYNRNILLLRKGQTKLNILSAEKISKSYTEKILFEDISLGIDEGDKICLIGINGTGKSTFLKVISGIETPDSGNITMGNSTKIEYLPQNPVFGDDITVLEYLYKTDSPVMNLIREYEAALLKTHKHPNDENLAKKLITLSQKMDSLNAWSEESKAKSILTKLNIYDFDALISTLSGGQKKRVAMASALISPAELLILDEPTNHIDNTTVDWLEKYLHNRKGALLMVTHDRYFLERVANRILELDSGKLYSYASKYSEYLEMKLEREELAITSDVKRKNLLRKELSWILRGARARSTKQKARIERFDKLSAEKQLTESSTVEINVASTRLGKKIIELDNISKGFLNRKLITNFSLNLQRDDRIGIIGPNGCGKTTLLNIIAGRLNSDSGEVSVGETVKIGYFSQECEEMDGNLRIIEYMRNIAEYVSTSEGSISASQMLEKFMFPPDVQWTPISKLSGGEKRRLFLLRILIDAPNILLLDEPTNDIDINTLTILEDYLDSFTGAVITVSHDRYFLDRVVKKIIAFENGQINEYNGGYSDNTDIFHNPSTESSSDKSNTEKKPSTRIQRENKPLKLTFNEQKEYENIENVISQLEAKLKTCEIDISLASSNFALLEELLLKQHKIENNLNVAMERWVYLSGLIETIKDNANKKG